MKVEVIVTVIIPGFHYWEGATEGVDFLSALHFHNFFIVAYKQVTDLDREIEYFEFADKIKTFINERFPIRHMAPQSVNFGTMSCEQIATILVEEMKLSACEVWEDKLFGSKVYA